MAFHWVWFIGLVVGELLLALALTDSTLPPGILHIWPMRAISQIAPVIGNFASVPGIHDGILIYLAVTIVLTPLKVLFWLIWLRSSFKGKFVYFVPSPRYWLGTRPSDFILGKNTPEVVASSRPVESYFSLRGLIVSLILAALILSFADAVLDWGYELRQGKDSRIFSVSASYKQIVDGGFSLWMSWGFRNILISFLLAVFLLIVREYWFLLKSFVIKEQ